MIGTLLARFFQMFSTQPPQQGALVQGEQEAEQGGSKIQTMEEPKDIAGEKGATASDGVSPVPAILEHLLPDVSFWPTPNKGGVIKPRFLLSHYTVSDNLEGTARYFQRKESKVSAHILIGRDGRMIQMVPFNRRAWHAGLSKWGDFIGLNDYSIGIEYINWGPLRMDKDDGKLYSEKGTVVAKSDAIYLDGRWWQRYTVEQLEVGFNVSRELFQFYGLEDSLGHFQVSPGRKLDPGPAFPLDALRDFCMAPHAEFRNKDGKVIALKDKDGK